MISSRVSCSLNMKLPITMKPLFASMSMFSVRMASGLSTNIKLHDPTLLRAPEPLFDSGRKSTLEVYNPAASQQQIEDGSAVIALIDAHNRLDAHKIIKDSANAFPKWARQTTGSYRTKLLMKWSELIQENKADIAKLMTLESGKPISESLGEIAYGVSFLDFYAGEAIRPTSAGGGTIWPTPFSMADGSPKATVMTINEPVGVSAHITPWNFPMAMITRKAGPALAAGCTVVLKPSELTPLTAIALHELALRAGIPKDVFQLIISATDTTPHIGEELCMNPEVRKISFTGSTRVGKLLMKMSSETVKKVSLELGGNAAFVVFDDADIDQAVKAAVASKFRNAGQTCVCADRFLVHEKVEQEFINQLCTIISTYKIGPGLNADTKIGPLISSAAMNGVHEKVKEAISDGAECLLGGNPMPELGPNFYQPTILRNVKTLSKIWNTETFGPVVAIRTFHTEDEAIELANDTRTGLASYLCTADMSRAFRVLSRLENGIVGVNEGIISSAVGPFGGVKESGLGREGSSAGIAEYLETKYVVLNH